MHICIIIEGIKNIYRVSEMKKHLEIGTNRFWNRKKIWRFFGRGNTIFSKKIKFFPETLPPPSSLGMLRRNPVENKSLPFNKG